MKLGSTCGTMPNQTRSTQLAPTARKPSSGFMSAFSTTSKNILPSAPTVWMLTARIAGIGPSEKIARKKPAITISGKARRISSTRRVTKRSQRLAVMIARREEAQQEAEGEADQRREQRDVERFQHLVEIFRNVEAAGQIDAAVGIVVFQAAVVIGRRQVEQRAHQTRASRAASGR